MLDRLILHNFPGYLNKSIHTMYSFMKKKILQTNAVIYFFFFFFFFTDYVLLIG